MLQILHLSQGGILRVGPGHGSYVGPALGRCSSLVWCFHGTARLTAPWLDSATEALALADETRAVSLQSQHTHTHTLYTCVHNRGQEDGSQ